MECSWVNTGAGRRPQCACPARRAAASDGEAARVSSTVDWSSVPPNSPAVPVTVPTHAALAPLSGWIVGKWGVPRSIALYFGFVTVALVPTVLLPLRGVHGSIARSWLGLAAAEGRRGGGAWPSHWPTTTALWVAQLRVQLLLRLPSSPPFVYLPADFFAELGRRRSQTTEHEAEPAPMSASKHGLSSKLARSSAGALLLPAEEQDSDELDGRQHNGHAAELAIELLGVSRASADAAAAEAVGNVMVERINSKLSRAGSLPAQAQVGWVL